MNNLPNHNNQNNQRVNSSTSQAQLLAEMAQTMNTFFNTGYQRLNQQTNEIQTGFNNINEKLYQ